MHYPFWAFSKNGNPTLEPSSTAIGADLGQRVGCLMMTLAKSKLSTSVILPRLQRSVTYKWSKGQQMVHVAEKGRARVKSRDKAGGKCNKAAEVQVREREEERSPEGEDDEEKGKEERLIKSGTIETDFQGNAMKIFPGVMERKQCKEIDFLTCYCMPL